MPRVSEQWGACKQIMEGHDSGVTGVVCSPDGKMIISSGCDSSIRTWDAATGEQCKVFLGHDDYVSAIDISADGRTIASASDDESVRLWSVPWGEERAKLEIAALTRKKHDVNIHPSCVSAVAFSPDGRTIAAACYDRIVKIWDSKKCKEQRMLKGHEQWVRSIAYSPDGNMVATGAEDGLIKL
jgi:WD40 repeat protein